MLKIEKNLSQIIKLFSMRLNYKMFFFGVILLAIGILMILYAQHGLHHSKLSSEAEPFFLRVRDFFISVGDWFTDTVEPKPANHHITQLKFTVWIGAIVTAIGALFIIFCVKRQHPK